MKFGCIVRTLSHLMKWRITSMEGFKNIPKTGPVLFVSNHVGQQDPVLIYTTLISATNGKMIHAITKWKILSGNFFQKNFGTIPLYQDRSKSIDISNNLLKKREFVLIFPEGMVNGNNIINRVKTGAARIALDTKTLVIPIGIQRVNKIPKTEFGHTMDIFFGRAKISIGNPIDLKAWYGKKITKQILLETGNAIMTKVAILANKKYLNNDQL